jgi:hypothetical protein
MIPQITVVPTRDGLLSAAHQLAVLDLANENRKRAQECRRFWWRFWRPVRAVRDPEEYLEAIADFHFNSLAIEIILHSISGNKSSVIDYEYLPDLPLRIVVHGNTDQHASGEMKF